MCERRFPINHDISYCFFEFFIRKSHILRILLLRHWRHVAAIIRRLPHHRTVAIRMRSDIMPTFCDGSQKIRIVLHIPGDDEKGPLRVMLAKDIEQMIQRSIRPPVIKREENSIVPDVLDDARMIHLLPFCL